jgi:hypothetical protein
MMPKFKCIKVLRFISLIIALAVVSCASLPDPSATVQTLLIGEVSVEAKNYDMKSDSRLSFNGKNTEGITLSITNYQNKTTTKIKCDKFGLFYTTELPAGNYYISNILLEKSIYNSSGGTTFSNISINPSSETLFVLKPKAATNLGKIIWETDAKRNSTVLPYENYNTAKSRLADLFPKSKWFQENWLTVKVAKHNDFEMDTTLGSSVEQLKKPRVQPADFKNSPIEKIVRQIPKTITDKQRTDPDGFLTDMVAFLTKDSQNTFESVKILHDWVADNIAYDAPSFFSGRLPDQSYKAVLSSKLAVCEGYANLFKKLCDLKGIPCTVVSGFSRGYGTSIFSNENPNNPNHAWNIVTVNQNLYLVDTTWDAGTLENNIYKKYYGTGYLFADPIAFLHSHYPTNPQNQLLSSPLDAQSFSSLPSLNLNYFSSGISYQTKLVKVNRFGNDFSIQFKVPAGVDMKFSIYDSTDKNELIGSSFKQQEGDTVSVNIALPKPGNYTLKLFKHEEKDFGETYIGCGEIGFIADKNSQAQYPSAFSGFQKGYQLISPLGNVLIPGTDVVFRVKLPDVASAYILLDDQVLKMNNEGNGIFSGRVSIPSSVSSVSLAKSKTQTEGWETLLLFPIQKK